MLLLAAPVGGAVQSAGVSATTNAPPDADAGDYRTYDEDLTVELDGSDSGDADGDELTYSWRQVDGPSVTMLDGDTPTPIIRTPNVDSPVVLEFVLTVDDGTATDSDRVRIAVQPGIETPKADAGPSQSVVEEQSVELDGTASYDPNLDPLTYRWTQTGGPSVDLEDPTTTTPTFVTPDVAEETTLTFDLSVTDDDGNTATDDVSVTIDPGPEVPIAKVGDDRTVDAGGTVTLDASASFDFDGDPLSFEWSQLSGTAVDVRDADTATAEFTAPDVSAFETLVFEVEVTDADGYSASERVEITVEPTGGGSATATRTLEDDSVGAGGSTTVTLSTTFDGAQDRVRIQDGFAGPVDDVDLTSITLDGEPIASEKIVFTQVGTDGVSATLSDVPADREISVTYEVTVAESASEGSTVEFSGVDGADVRTPVVSAEFGDSTLTVSGSDGGDGSSGEGDESTDEAVSRSVTPANVTENGTIETRIEATVTDAQPGMTIRDSVEGPVGDLTVTGATLNGEPLPTGMSLFTFTSEQELEFVLRDVPAGATVGVNYTVTVNGSASPGDVIEFVGRSGDSDVKGRTFDGEFGTDVVEVTDEVGVTERFDEDGDGGIDDGELRASITAWVSGSISDSELQTLIQVWVTS